MYLRGALPSNSRVHSFFAHVLLSFSSKLALLAAPINIIIQRGQSSPRSIRIKPDPIPNPEHVLNFFEQLEKDANGSSEPSTAPEIAPEEVLSDPYVFHALIVFFRKSECMH
jgi:hypothetical protein